MYSPDKVGMDPLRKGKRISTNLGFTLIELMMVITVVGIVAAFALPSYRNVIEKRQVTSGAEQIAAFLSAAQIEAVKRNERFIVSYSKTASVRDDWCLGVTTNVAACDCTQTNAAAADACVIDAQLRLFTDADLNYPGIMNAMQGDGSFVYDPVRGLARNPATDAPIGTVSLELLSPKDKYALNVQLSASGRVKTCSKDSSTQVPGYHSC